MTDRLKQIREKNSLNQTDFAKRISISQSMYSGIENGREILTDRNIKIICLEFGINEDWLRDGTGEMFKPSPPPIKEGELGEKETDLLNTYRVLEEPTQEYLLEQAHGLLKTQNALLGIKEKEDEAKEQPGA